MKKINITTFLLIVYLIVMAVLFWPGNNPENGFLNYFVVLGGTLFIIIILRFIQIKRLKMREKWKEDNDKPTTKP